MWELILGWLMGAPQDSEGRARSLVGQSRAGNIVLAVVLVIALVAGGYYWLRSDTNY